MNSFQGTPSGFRLGVDAGRRNCTEEDEHERHCAGQQGVGVSEQLGDWTGGLGRHQGVAVEAELKSLHPVRTRGGAADLLPSLNQPAVTFKTLLETLITDCIYYETWKKTHKTF